MKKIIKVDEDYINARIDRWIKSEYNSIPQSLIEKNLRLGKIKVNLRKIKSSYKLKINDKIYLYNFEPKIKINKKEKFIPSKKEIHSSEKFVIEDNENFIVINKPPGIAVQGGTKSFKNIVDTLSKSEIFKNTKPYIVHRIDKDTSGILIIAKTRQYAQLLTSLFRIRKIHKTYLALCTGELNSDNGILEDVLIRYDGKKKIEESAKTSFKVLDKNFNASLLSLNPITGRKHQIRKQLSIINHPIYGDSKYNFKTKNKNLMLHAFAIKFKINHIKYNFSVNFPEYFDSLLKKKKLFFNKKHLKDF